MEDMVSFWHGRSVLVTGATGLVGGWLVAELLRSEADVVCLVRDMDPSSMFVNDGLSADTSVVSGVVEDLAVVERTVVDHDVQIVFHLAAQTIVSSGLRNPHECIVSNVLGTTSVLEAARRHGDLVDAVVVASSDKAYGSSDALPYVESMPLHGDHPYDVSKSCTDLITTAYHTSYGTPVGIARCGNIFGGGDLNWSRLVPGTIRSLIAAQTPVIRSDGLMRRDFLHVSDAVQAYMHLARGTINGTANGEAFNFSYGEPLTVIDMYDRICRATVGARVEPQIKDTAHHEIPDQYLDSTKAADMLGWTPGTGLDKGLEATAHWYRTYWERRWQGTSLDQ